MSISQIARKFSVSATAAGNARKNGWIAQKLGASVNYLPDGKFPEGVLIEDVVSDVDKATRWVFRRFSFNKQEMDDVRQEIIIRLLEQTAAVNFINPKWRRKFAYYAGVKYITRKVYPYNCRFFRFNLEEFEEYLSNDNIFSETAGGDSIDYEDIISRLSLKNRRVVEKWADKRRQKNYPKKVIKILESIRKLLGLN